jgi:hypothetical protein
MIMSGPEAFWGSLERRVTHSLVAWSDEAVAEYQQAFFKPETVHGVGLLGRLRPPELTRPCDHLTIV